MTWSYHLRRLAVVLGVDDDLDIGEIGNGVEPHGSHGDDATENGEQQADYDHELVTEGPLDDLVQHVRLLDGRLAA